MANKALPGGEYFGRMAQFYTDQFQYWRDVTARATTTAERIRGNDAYELKDWLKDLLDLWNRSLTAAESLVSAPLYLSGDQTTPIISFLVGRERTTTDPKTARIAPVDDTVLLPSGLFKISNPENPETIGAQCVVAQVVRRGLLEVSFQGLARDLKPGEYIGSVGNSDGPLAILHLSRTQ